MTVHLDPRNVSHCPLGVRCEACGIESAFLAVAVAQTVLGWICLTLCPTCKRSEHDPPITLRTTQNLVRQHREHLARALGVLPPAV